MAPPKTHRPPPPNIRRIKPGHVSRARPPARIIRPKPPKRAILEKEDDVDALLDQEQSLLDLVDNLLNRGVVLNAELIIGVAGVDLVYLRLSALLAAADRVLPQSRSTNVRARAENARRMGDLGGLLPPRSSR